MCPEKQCPEIEVTAKMEENAIWRGGGEELGKTPRNLSGVLLILDLEILLFIASTVTIVL